MGAKGTGSTGAVEFNQIGGDIRGDVSHSASVKSEREIIDFECRSYLASGAYLAQWDAFQF